MTVSWVDVVKENEEASSGSTRPGYHTVSVRLRRSEVVRGVEKQLSACMSSSL